MQGNAHEGGEGTDGECSCGNRRRTRVSVVMLAFVAGIGVWHLVGFWAFLESLVHGLAPPRGNLIATIIEKARPSEGARIMARVEAEPQSVAVSASCIALSLPRTGLEAMPTGCPVHHRDLREARGVAVRDHRLGSAKPLMVTFGPAAQAPVAGWVARVADPAKAVDAGALPLSPKPADQ